ncbi:unnamed protein product [marine sediment metagenome]|uniref:Uncharacterized protein n=1 Tax=marine sediment metagenome TaxID=412755 RepID=X0URG7_9ZZZZ
MLDLFGPSSEDVNRSNMAHATNHMAVCIALIDKGILTPDEIEACRGQATHIVEQRWAEKEREAKIAFDKEHPGMRDMMNKLFGEAAGEEV